MQGRSQYNEDIGLGPGSIGGDEVRAESEYIIKNHYLEKCQIRQTELTKVTKTGAEEKKKRFKTITNNGKRNRAYT